QAKNRALIGLIRQRVPCAIVHVPGTVITAHSKHSVRPVHKDAASAVVSMKPVWNGCVPISKLKRTKKPCGNVRCGSSPYSQKPKIGMVCDAFVSGGSG